MHRGSLRCGSTGRGTLDPVSPACSEAASLDSSLELGGPSSTICVGCTCQIQVSCARVAKIRLVEVGLEELVLEALAHAHHEAKKLKRMKVMLLLSQMRCQKAVNRV